METTLAAHCGAISVGNETIHLKLMPPGRLEACTLWLEGVTEARYAYHLIHRVCRLGRSSIYTRAYQVHITSYFGIVFCYRYGPNTLYYPLLYPPDMYILCET